MSRAAELLREALALLESASERSSDWTDGMSEPREDGAVQLSGIEWYRDRNAERLAAKGQNLTRWYFVPQAAAKLRAAGDPRAEIVESIAQSGAWRHNMAFRPDGDVIPDAAAYNYPSLERTVAEQIARVEDRMNDTATGTNFWPGQDDGA